LWHDTDRQNNLGVVHTRIEIRSIDGYRHLTPGISRSRAESQDVNSSEPKLRLSGPARLLTLTVCSVIPSSGQKASVFGPTAGSSGGTDNVRGSATTLPLCCRQPSTGRILVYTKYTIINKHIYVNYQKGSIAGERWLRLFD